MQGPLLSQATLADVRANPGLKVPYMCVCVTPRLVSDLRGDERHGIDNGISMKALEADLFEHSVQLSRRESNNE